MHTKQTSRDTFQANENGSKNTNYPNDKQFISAINNLSDYGRYRANSPYVKDWEIQKLDRIMKTLVEFFNNWIAQNENKNHSEQEQSIRSKYNKALLIAQLTGLTEYGITVLLKMPHWFLRNQLRQMKFSEEYLQHPEIFESLKSRFNALYSLVLFDKTTLNQYQTFIELERCSRNRQIKENYNKLIEQLEKDNLHLAELFYKIRTGEIITDSLENKIMEIYDNSEN